MPLDFIGFPGIFLQFMYEVRKGILLLFSELINSVAHFAEPDR